ncbi:helix-turn-helix domain-containing transcriptional regulator [Helicobacter bizzozeronii]|uniref:Uncharacterized protein n=1 Tax=Helicobacter bizzozeronii (strain CIII-1) TaxID=1002804 RepID=F8KUG3_HELBC|nr:hypothetical protein [Helicobacter bizzozeronii]CCB80898.1 hypothetical protein HBZC1_p0180 [Helicobacter bizzozeronii CIII-1]
MKVTLKPFRVAQMLDTDERRLSYLNAVLKDGDMVELKDALEVVAESKGIKDIDLSDFNGGVVELLGVLHKFGFTLQTLEIQEYHSA